MNIEAITVEVSRLSLNPGDVVLVRPITAMTPARHAEFSRAVGSALRSVCPDNKCLVLNREVELSVLGADEVDHG